MMFNKTMHLRFAVICILGFFHISIQSEYSDITSNIPSIRPSENINTTINAIRNSTTPRPYHHPHLQSTKNVNFTKVTNAVLHYKQSEYGKNIRGIQGKGIRM